MEYYSQTGKVIIDRAQCFLETVSPAKTIKENFTVQQPPSFGQLKINNNQRHPLVVG